jgi:hypothetical protein
MNVNIKIDDLDQLHEVTADSAGRVSLGSDLADERALIAVLPQIILETDEDNIDSMDLDSRGRANLGREWADEELCVAVIDVRSSEDGTTLLNAERSPASDERVEQALDKLGDTEGGENE